MNITAFPPDRIIAASLDAAAALSNVCPNAINPRALVRALAEVESSFGTNCAPRHERAYDLRGKLHDANTPGGEALRGFRRVWGAWAACSYGPWQVMYAVARELGFNVTPVELAENIGLNGMVASALLRKRIFREVPTGSDRERCLEIIGDSYNTGNSRDANIPSDYIEKLKAAYALHLGQTREDG